LSSQTQILSDLKSIARAISFSGFIAIPLILFALHSVKQSIRLSERVSYSITLLFWILSSQLFL